MLKGKALTPSNILSLFRIFLLVPIYQSLSENTASGNYWALLYMFLAVVSDFLDGFLARQLKQVSDLGKVLDPIADNICIIGVTLILASPVRANPLPLWFLLVILFRDVSIIGGGYLIYRRREVITTSNIWGKSTSTIIAGLLISNALQLHPASPWLFWVHYQFLLWLSLSFLVVSTASYVRRFYLLLTEKNTVASASLLNADGANRSSQVRRNSGET